MVMHVAGPVVRNPYWRAGADVASATALALPGGPTYFVVTGTTTITSISTQPAGRVVVLRFSGALTLTHNATTLILQGAVNLATAANDLIVLVSEGSGNWRELVRRTAGVQFPGTAVASSNANNLDDYEEGTWTAGITFGGGSVDMTFNRQVGWYTKIGNLVKASCYVSLTAKGTSTGAAVITGLPFTSANITNRISPVSLHIAQVAYVGRPQGNVDINSTSVTLSEVIEAGTLTDLLDTDFAGNSAIQMSVAYNV